MDYKTMKSSREREKYGDYKKKVINLLDENRTWEEYGIWRATGKLLAHILPVEYVNDRIEYRNKRADAIKTYTNLNCRKCLGDGLIGLHPYAHHLTSSQQLCMKFFSELVERVNDKLIATEEMVNFVHSAFEIDIHAGAECCFEYAERNNPLYMFDVDGEGTLIRGEGKYEGTSFDFYIKDKKSDIEIFFEIKFTEQGFKKEKCTKTDIATKKEIENKRHLVKAAEYLRIAPQFLRDSVATPHDFLKQYQIYRNIIRATDSNKYIVFIIDENNTATTADRKMIEKFGFPPNIKFSKWQDLIHKYPFELPLQLKAIQNYKNT